MVENPDDIPVTYLNKGQAYTLNILDTHHNKHSAHQAWYRTFVRVSFEAEEQRQKPSACWQLWKEGRGTNEAHQRGGLLQAVEYVESGQAGGPEDPSKPRVEVLSSSFDGFCVKWAPPQGTGECPISVRFNFLSTDFSHSKGVKGIPVRLCAKTELIDEVSNAALSSDSEVCFSKVKLFRDHGAERKISNDGVHVKKIMDKIRKQISEIEAGVREFGKRKRSGSIAKASGLDNRPSKIAKHRRTWSMSSVTSNSGRGGPEEDLHNKLQAYADMLKSARPLSVLNLRGEEEDDPDLHPVKISLEIPELTKQESTETAWDGGSSQNEPPSSSVSPVPSARSLSAVRTDSKGQQPTPVPGASRMNSNEWEIQPQPQTATRDIERTPPANPQQLATPDIQPSKVQTRSPNSGRPSGWIEAQDVDPSYEPPSQRAIKPIACFYIQPRVAGRPTGDNFHRAIYIFRRTLKDFVNAAAIKCEIEPTQVMQTVRINRKGLRILFDDECIRELPEGQDMAAEFHEVSAEPSGKRTREWNASSTDIQVDGDLTTLENVSSNGYELRLLF